MEEGIEDLTTLLSVQDCQENKNKDTEDLNDISKRLDIMEMY